MTIMHSFRGVKGAILLAAVATAFCASRAGATTLPLTNATPGVTNTYSYTTQNPADPNATFTGGVAPDPNGYYGNSTVGTISYTFDLAPFATNLNLTGANLFANDYTDPVTYPTGPTDGITLDYSLSGGHSGSGNLLTLLTSSFTPEGVEIPSFNENIQLAPTGTDTLVTITFSSTSTTGHQFQEQMLRMLQAFVATASFSPEPDSLGLLALGALNLMARRRHA